MDPRIVIKTENPDTVQAIPGKSNLRRLAYAACGLILGIVAVLLVVSLLIYGNAKNKDVIFHIAHTGETIKENIEITDREEIIVTSRATFIFDYQNEWLVTKLSDTGTNVCYIGNFKMNRSIDNERKSLVNIKEWLVTKLSDTGTNVCYIGDFKMKSGIDIERESLVNIKTEVLVKDENIIRIHFKSTDKFVDASMLSPMAASMCHQSRLVWLTDVTNE